MFDLSPAPVVVAMMDCDATPVCRRGSAGVVDHAVVRRHGEDLGLCRAERQSVATVSQWQAMGGPMMNFALGAGWRQRSAGGQLRRARIVRVRTGRAWAAFWS